MKRTGLSDSPFFDINSNDNNRFNIKENNSKIQNIQGTLEDSIYYSVIRVGKIAATYRFSEYEKKKLQKIIFSLRMKNILISENVLIRIAIENLLYDYKKRSKGSILYRMAMRLNIISFKNPTQ